MQIKEYLQKMKNFKQNLNKETCNIHNKDKYISYCFNCNCHLCNECLKLRNHSNHQKNYLIEIQPTKKELEIIKKIIQ